MLAMFTISWIAQAQEYPLCDKIERIKSQAQPPSQRYTLMQTTFEGVQTTVTDLAIVIVQENQPTQIKRVTFGRGVAGECTLQPMALEIGGDWGWHMLWAEPTGLLYARMDGEAWVSSNPKVLTKLSAINPQFKLDNQNILVTWQQVENGVTADMQAISNDEGRSWDIMSLSGKDH